MNILFLRRQMLKKRNNIFDRIRISSLTINLMSEMYFLKINTTVKNTNYCEVYSMNSVKYGLLIKFRNNM